MKEVVARATRSRSSPMTAWPHGVGATMALLQTPAPGVTGPSSLPSPLTWPPFPAGVQGAGRQHYQRVVCGGGQPLLRQF